MPVRLGGDVKYLCLAITNLLRATATSQEKSSPASAKPLPLEIRHFLWTLRNSLRTRRQHRHVPFAPPDLRRGDVFRRSNKRSAQQRKRRRRFHEDQNA